LPFFNCGSIQSLFVTRGGRIIIF